MPSVFVRIALSQIGGVYPLLDLVPRLVVVEMPRDEVEVDSRPAENVGNLWDATRLTMREPFARHHAAVTHRIECFVVNRRDRLQVENDYRYPRSLDRRQNGGRERVSTDVEEDDLRLLAAEANPRLLRRGGGVHEADVYHLGAELAEAVGDLRHVPLEPWLQPVKLWPVSREPDPE